MPQPLKQKLAEALQFGSLLIAYDYDDTVCPYHSDENDPEIIKVREVLARAKEQGNILILHTCRPVLTENMAEFLADHRITPDYVNESPLVLDFDEDGRGKGRVGKPFYNIMLDDKSGLTYPLAALTYALDKQLEISFLLKTLTDKEKGVLKLCGLDPAKHSELNGRFILDVPNKES